MSNRASASAGLSAAQRRELERLTHRAAVAWPTVAVWVAVLGTFIVSDVVSVMGIIPLWGGMLINSLVGYYAFTVVHDGVHFAICRNKRVNDWIAQSTVMLAAPYLSLPAFRWGHLKHHRYTNNPEFDPDYVLHGAWWTLPFRWAFIDVIYLIHILRRGDAVAFKHLRKSTPWIAGTLAAIVGLSLAGYGMAVLMLWFIPSRLIFISLGFSFFWLPHVPHDTRQEDNFTRATTVRIGYERLMAPLLQWQHYHLIHHLYPTTPFYNNEKVWRLLEPQLRHCDLAIQHDFGIQPSIYAADRVEERSKAA